MQGKIGGSTRGEKTSDGNASRIDETTVSIYDNNYAGMMGSNRQFQFPKTPQKLPPFDLNNNDVHGQT